MIHRLKRGQIPAKPHTVFEVDGSLCYEHCFTRAGFEAVYTIMWHRTPPHWVESQEDLGRHPGWAEGVQSAPLRRSHYLSSRLGKGDSPFLSRRLLFTNPDMGVWLGRPTESEPTLVANADGDELTFVHEGSGRVECPLGVVAFSAHDYVYVPQGMPHRFVLDGPALLLTMEARSPLRVPKQYRVPEGQLSMYAPYTHHDFSAPSWPDNHTRTRMSKMTNRTPAEPAAHQTQAGPEFRRARAETPFLSSGRGWEIGAATGSRGSLRIDCDTDSIAG